MGLAFYGAGSQSFGCDFLFFFFFFCLSFFVLFFVLINYGSSRHFDNLKNNFLVLGDGLTDVVSNSVNEPECLSLHHNTEER